MKENNRKLNIENIIIIGAPRSGTNLLRNLLTAQDKFGTWPCDEINYIWRHHNINYSSDEFPKELARKSVKKYIKKQFEYISKKLNCRYLVEKTCANSLRIDFVKQIFPEAKFIFIYRDCFDCVYSACKEWKNKPKINYLYKKAKYIPKVDIPFYGSKYFFNLIFKLLNKESKYRNWGPIFNNQKKITRNLSLEMICAHQWIRCLEKSLESFEKMNSNEYICISYEDFIKNPEKNLLRINKFIDPKNKINLNYKSLEIIKRNNFGKANLEIDDATKEKISCLIKPIQKKLKKLDL